MVAQGPNKVFFSCLLAGFFSFVPLEDAPFSLELDVCRVADVGLATMSSALVSVVWCRR